MVEVYWQDGEPRVLRHGKLLSLHIPSSSLCFLLGKLAW